MLPPIWGGERVKVASLTSQGNMLYNFAFSPDNTQLTIARGRPQSDVLLIDNMK